MAPQVDTEQVLLDNLTGRTKRALHRADDLGYDVKIGILDDPAAAVVTLTPRDKRLRLRFKAAGFQDRAIRGAAPLIEDDPSVDCFAIEAAVEEALRLHDQRLGLVSA